MGNFSKFVARIILPKLPTFICNFCKGIKIFHFSIEIIFGQLLKTFGDFVLVTLADGQSSGSLETFKFQTFVEISRFRFFVAKMFFRFEPVQSG